MPVDDQLRETPTVQPPRPLNRWQLAGASLLIAGGIVGVGLGLGTARTGDGSNSLPKEVEKIIPVRSATRVVAQSEIYADLIEGYTGEFIIDGTAIPTVNVNDLSQGSENEQGALPKPGAQVSLPPATVFEPFNATLTFAPAPGGPIESFAVGRHTVTLRFWPVEVGERAAKTLTWTFETF